MFQKAAYTDIGYLPKINASSLIEFTKFCTGDALILLLGKFEKTIENSSENR